MKITESKSYLYLKKYSESSDNTIMANIKNIASNLVMTYKSIGCSTLNCKNKYMKRLKSILNGIVKLDSLMSKEVGIGSIASRYEDLSKDLQEFCNIVEELHYGNNIYESFFENRNIYKRKFY